MLLRVSLLILLGVLCYNVCLNTTWGFASCSSLKNSGVLIASRIPSISTLGPSTGSCYNRQQIVYPVKIHYRPVHFLLHLPQFAPFHISLALDIK